MLHNLLGRGAMGQVFRGSVRESGQPVAVKVLKPELVSDPEVVARFFQERLILTSVEHPNVAKVLDLVIEGDTIGIVMELVDGPDLRRYLRQRGTLPPAEAVDLTCQLLRGLAAVHAGSIVHRDVKPENVLLSLGPGATGLKLTDFGVSRLSYGSSLTKVSSLIGTPEYMAPELADHDRATPAADLYSAGIVLYEMLAGRTPFAGGHPMAVLRRQLEQAPPPVPGLPGELWAQIDGLLHKDPRGRPGSAAAALGPLEQLQRRLVRLPALVPVAVATADREWADAAAVPGGIQRPAATPPGPAAPPTILRHRNHEGGPALAVDDLTRPAADRGNSRPAAPSGPRSRPRIRPWLVTGVLVAMVAVLGTLLVLQDARSLWHKPPTARPPSAVAYTFPVQRYASGLMIARRWTLGGQRGTQLTETVTASSTTGKTLTAWFKDTVPAAVASSVQTLRFTTDPGKVVRPDPVVEWYLRLPAHGSLTVGYVATVLAGSRTTGRLTGWAKGLDALEQRLNSPAVRRPKPTPSPTSSATAPVAPAYTFTPTASPSYAATPDPFPTYECDPTVVTCTPATQGAGLGF
jgi:hypothetical protein